MLEYFDGIVYSRKNYITDAECIELTDWALSNKDKEYANGITREEPYANAVTYDKRLTTRFKNTVQYPQLVKEIQNKIIKDYNPKKIFYGQGTDGIISSITYNGGNIYKHIDGNSTGDIGRLNFNIVVSTPELGGDLIVNNKKYMPQRGELMSYFASEYFHEVETCYGNTPRIIFIFGFEHPVKGYMPC